MKKNLLLIAALLIGAVASAGNTMKPRVIVMTDAEVDDRCSMVHLLLHANDCDIAAIIQTNSCHQLNGWSHEHWLETQIDHYAEVYPNLIVHDPDYPSPDKLRAAICVGDEDKAHLAGFEHRDITQPGVEPKIDPTGWPETEGSRRIVEILLDQDPRKVYIQAWGGGNTAAKAFQILKDRHPQDYERAVGKVVMYNIMYQDGAGPYIERFHPGVTMILSTKLDVWGYGGQEYTSEFVDKYLHQGHGALCQDYLQDAIAEGDSPAFLYALDNGLRSFEDPTYGGWGGMFQKADGFDNVYIDTDASDTHLWREQVLREFQARAQWCVTPDRLQANHHPVVAITEGSALTVKSGEPVTLHATAIDDEPIDLDYAWEQMKYVLVAVSRGRHLPRRPRSASR